MDIKYLKEHILNNKKIEYVLEEIGCHSINYHVGEVDNYYTCGNYNGDNKSAVIVYENEYLVCENYTREISTNKQKSSLIDLVMYNKSLDFFKTVKYLCDILGLDYYHEEEDDLPESIKITLMLLEMNKGNMEDEDVKLKPIDEYVLSYYKNYTNSMFFNDGIDYGVQRLFEVGYDDDMNCITIPIRSELGDLVGVKGRYFDYEIESNKYVYLERCSKSKVLYGLDKSIDYIKEAGYVFIVESEKAVMQLWSMGFKNCVATSGKKVSKYQLYKLLAMGVDLFFCYDSDVERSELNKIAERVPSGFNVYFLIDESGILLEKESPTDSKNKFLCLINDENNIKKGRLV